LFVALISYIYASNLFIIIIFFIEVYRKAITPIGLYGL